MTEEDEPLSPEEEVQLQRYAEQLGQGVPQIEERTGVFQFLKKVFEGEDTTKVSCLDLKELSSVRIYQDTAQYCNLMGMEKVAEYLNKSAEIILGTALSKKPGILLQAAITQKRELRSGSLTKQKKKFFGGKEDGQQ